MAKSTRDSKRFVVLGLGTFGKALALRLHQNGCRVTGVDFNEKRVDALKDRLYEAILADVTDRLAMEQVLLPRSDAVFIALGESIERSILAALHARELGIKHVFAKGVSDEHARILRALGVERVIFPEAEAAVQLADTAAWPSLVTSLQIDSNYSIVELAVPQTLVGLTLIEADIRKKYDIVALAVKDALTGSFVGIPHGDFRLGADHLLLVIGAQKDLARFSLLE